MCNNQTPQQKRFSFLKLLYQKSEGNTQYQIKANILGSELDLDEKETNKVVDFLSQKGFIEQRVLGPEIAITIIGIEEVEDFNLSDGESLYESILEDSGILKRCINFLKTQFSFSNFWRPTLIIIVGGAGLYICKDFYKNRNEQHPILKSNRITSDTLKKMKQENEESTHENLNQIKKKENSDSLIETKEIIKEQPQFQTKSNKINVDKNYVILQGRKYPNGAKEVYKEFQVEFLDIPPELFAWVRVGMKSTNYFEPAAINASVVTEQYPEMELISIISNEPAKLMFPSTDGRKAYIADHPTKRTVRGLIQTQLVEYEGVLLLNHKRLFLGDTIQFPTTHHIFTCKVVSF